MKRQPEEHRTDVNGDGTGETPLADLPDDLLVYLEHCVAQFDADFNRVADEFKALVSDAGPGEGDGSSASQFTAENLRRRWLKHTKQQTNQPANAAESASSRPADTAEEKERDEQKMNGEGGATETEGKPSNVSDFNILRDSLRGRLAQIQANAAANLPSMVEGEGTGGDEQPSSTDARGEAADETHEDETEREGADGDAEDDSPVEIYDATRARVTGGIRLQDASPPSTSSARPATDETNGDASVVVQMALTETNAAPIPHSLPSAMDKKSDKGLITSPPTDSTFLPETNETQSVQQDTDEAAFSQKTKELFGTDKVRELFPDLPRSWTHPMARDMGAGPSAADEESAATIPSFDAILLSQHVNPDDPVDGNLVQLPPGLEDVYSALRQGLAGRNYAAEAPPVDRPHSQAPRSAIPQRFQPTIKRVRREQETAPGADGSERSEAVCDGVERIGYGEDEGPDGDDEDDVGWLSLRARMKQNSQDLLSKNNDIQEPTRPLPPLVRTDLFPPAPPVPSTFPEPPTPPPSHAPSAPLPRVPSPVAIMREHPTMDDELPSDEAPSPSASVTASAFRDGSTGADSTSPGDASVGVARLTPRLLTEIEREEFARETERRRDELRGRLAPIMLPRSPETIERLAALTTPAATPSGTAAARGREAIGRRWMVQMEEQENTEMAAWTSTNEITKSREEDQPSSTAGPSAARAEGEEAAPPEVTDDQARQAQKERLQSQISAWFAQRDDLSLFHPSVSFAPSLPSFPETHLDAFKQLPTTTTLPPCLARCTIAILPWGCSSRVLTPPSDVQVLVLETLFQRGLVTSVSQLPWTCVASSALMRHQMAIRAAAHRSAAVLLLVLKCQDTSSVLDVAMEGSELSLRDALWLFSTSAALLNDAIPLLMAPLSFSQHGFASCSVGGSDALGTDMHVESICVTLRLQPSSAPTLLPWLFKHTSQESLLCIGLRLVYSTPSTIQSSPTLSLKRSQTPYLPTLILALRGPFALTKWHAIQGPADPTLARRTDPSSLNALYGGQDRGSAAATSVQAPHHAMMEVIWAFGGRIDLTDSRWDGCTVGVGDRLQQLVYGAANCRQLLMKNSPAVYRVALSNQLLPQCLPQLIGALQSRCGALLSISSLPSVSIACIPPRTSSFVFTSVSEGGWEALSSIEEHLLRPPVQTQGWRDLTKAGAHAVSQRRDSKEKDKGKECGALPLSFHPLAGDVSVDPLGLLIRGGDLRGRGMVAMGSGGAGDEDTPEIAVFGACGSLDEAPGLAAFLADVLCDGSIASRIRVPEDGRDDVQSFDDIPLFGGALQVIAFTLIDLKYHNQISNQDAAAKETSAAASPHDDLSSLSWGGAGSLCRDNATMTTEGREARDKGIKALMAPHLCDLTQLQRGGSHPCPLEDALRLREEDLKDGVMFLCAVRGERAIESMIGPLNRTARRHISQRARAPQPPVSRQLSGSLSNGSGPVVRPVEADDIVFLTPDQKAARAIWRLFFGRHERSVPVVGGGSFIAHPARHRLSEERYHPSPPLTHVGEALLFSSALRPVMTSTVAVLLAGGLSAASGVSNSPPCLTSALEMVAHAAPTHNIEIAGVYTTPLPLTDLEAAILCRQELDDNRAHLTPSVRDSVTAFFQSLAMSAHDGHFIVWVTLKGTNVVKRWARLCGSSYAALNTQLSRPALKNQIGHIPLSTTHTPTATAADTSAFSLPALLCATSYQAAQFLLNQLLRRGGKRRARERAAGSGLEGYDEGQAGASDAAEAKTCVIVSVKAEESLAGVLEAFLGHVLRVDPPVELRAVKTLSPPEIHSFRHFLAHQGVLVDTAVTMSAPVASAAGLPSVAVLVCEGVHAAASIQGVCDRHYRQQAAVKCAVAQTPTMVARELRAFFPDLYPPVQRSQSTRARG
ncbi:unnamed protein product [Vitrella brassicaformis CCMP3155]|uniref:Uncharacterized protein n=3 Tax=Vitrella brassicaformis TaxID=1169539 RepID=A0A0G4FMS0_VITBC|nr:unnamed protein product [Vitrella brassicaformis CCMP3155]|eukprot:CEM15460.1 unnamed protein product [Vitrella brassicaformis CCMP3155]